MLSFFPRDVLDEILNLIESVSEGFPSYSFTNKLRKTIIWRHLKCWLKWVDSQKVTALFYDFLVASPDKVSYQEIVSTPEGKRLLIQDISVSLKICPHSK